jgi:hypothetical protein
MAGGQASPTPVKTGQGLADGSGGLGTETDAVLGIDGDQHPFSGFLEASFQTIPLWSFIYSYADGKAFYSGTVATTDTLSSRTINNGSGNVVGTYSVFQQGLTTRTAGTVIVDRFTLGGLVCAARCPWREQRSGRPRQRAGFITVNGATLAFSDLIEPAVRSACHLAVNAAAQHQRCHYRRGQRAIRRVLGAVPTPRSGQLQRNAAAAPALRRFARSRGRPKPRSLQQLYHQILGRDIDQGGIDTYTNALINGSSMLPCSLFSPSRRKPSRISSTSISRCWGGMPTPVV